MPNSNYRSNQNKACEGSGFVDKGALSLDECRVYCDNDASCQVFETGTNSCRLFVGGNASNMSCSLEDAAGKTTYVRKEYGYAPQERTNVGGTVYRSGTADVDTLSKALAVCTSEKKCTGVRRTNASGLIELMKDGTSATKSGNTDVYSSWEKVHVDCVTVYGEWGACDANGKSSRSGKSYTESYEDDAQQPKHGGRVCTPSQETKDCCSSFSCPADTHYSLPGSTPGSTEAECCREKECASDADCDHLGYDGLPDEKCTMGGTPNLPAWSCVKVKATTGSPCKSWDNVPDDAPQWLKNYSGWTDNFCRNPGGMALHWCYTEDDYSKWGYCE